MLRRAYSCAGTMRCMLIAPRPGGHRGNVLKALGSARSGRLQPAHRGPATAIWGFSRISTGHCRSPGSARPDQRRDINRLLHTRSYYALLSACGTLITPTQQALYSVADAWAVYGSVDTVFMAARAQVAAGE